MTSPSRRRVSTAAALFAAAPNLFSCGGGSEAGAKQPATATPSPSTAPPPPSTSPPSPSVPPPPGAGSWPLRIHGSGRYLVTNTGSPFFIQGDTPWSIVVQLTNAQIDAYLSDRKAKGFNAILFNAVEHYFSSQTPRWRSVDGHVPFSPDGNFGVRVEAYWQIVDYVIAQANQRGIICMVNPAYLGFGGGGQGWTVEIQAESDADLRNFGSWLATRYANAGIIWCLGGDYAGPQHPGLLAKQWNIALGLRAVDSGAIITAHGGVGDSPYAYWSGFTGFNLNNVYAITNPYAAAATEYARPGPMPFFFIEGHYDGESGANAADVRRQAYMSVLSGACGHFFGNQPLWGFGEPDANAGIGPAAALSTALNTTATQQIGHVKTLFTAFAWEKLRPQTDASLVTTPLGNGTARICPALAADRSFAMVWTSGASFSVNLMSLAAPNVRARWFSAVDGSYASVVGSPFANTGIQAFMPPGERVLVLDAA